MAIVFEYELRLPATIEGLDAVMDWVTEKLDYKDCPRKVQNHIAVVTEELFVNICNYAYGDSGGQAVIRLTFKDQQLCMQFEDFGIPFNPLEHEAPDLTTSIEDRQIGGLGIYITTKWMDTVDYERKNDKNILTISKSIPLLDKPKIPK
jgi:anti-sigma regulatory factor (Ser/Thr protein kinase)